jgi:hypothetical protein
VIFDRGVLGHRQLLLVTSVKTWKITQVVLEQAAVGTGVDEKLVIDLAGVARDLERPPNVFVFRRHHVVRLRFHVRIHSSFLLLGFTSTPG